MKKSEMIETLQLILSRSSAAQGEATDTLKAFRVKSPMAERRYERTLSTAMADPTVDWTMDERALLGRYWTETCADNDDDAVKLRTLRLSERDWKRAQKIGNGDATAGIRAALREYPKPN